MKKRYLILNIFLEDMDLKKRASFISLMIVLTLTIGKFIAYYLSGSIAVFSEAWHSMSDVGTTLLVFLAILSSSHIFNKDQKDKENVENGDNEDKKGFNPEIFVSFIISFALLMISISIFWEIFTKEIGVINKPLVTGLIFIFFSMGSYFLSQFQSKIGKISNSSALIADGIHSKGDMITSLLTGISLILYNFSIDLDKPIAFFISFYIFLLSILVFKKGMISIHNLKNPDDIKEEWSIVDQFFKKILEKLKFKKFFIKIFKIFTPLSILLYLFYTSIYIVNVGEVGIKERFGKPLHSVSPGLHFKFPDFIDKIHIINMEKIRVLNIGNVVTEGKPLIWTQLHGSSEEWITGDDQFLLPYITIHYKIGRPYHYIYQNLEPELLLKNIFSQVLQKIFASHSLDQLMVNKRGELIEKIEKKVQKKLYESRSGINIVNISIKDMHPPRTVAKSFEKVVATIQEVREMLYRSEAYKYRNIPLANSESFRRDRMAKIYKFEKIKEAEKERDYYDNYLKAYFKYKKISKRIIYLDKMKKILVDTQKVLLDPAVNHLDYRIKGVKYKINLD